MAVTFVSAGALASVNTATPLVILEPPGTAVGDLLVVMASNTLGSVPPGWTSIPITNRYFWWKPATTGDDAVTISVHPSVAYGMGQMFAFRGAQTTGTPIIFGPPDLGGSPIAGIVTQDPGELVIVNYVATNSFDDSGLDLPLPTFSAPGLSNFTKRGEGRIYHVYAQYNGGRYAFQLYTGVKSPAGDTGNLTWVNGSGYLDEVYLGRILPYIPPASTPLSNRFNRGFNHGLNLGFN